MKKKLFFSAFALYSGIALCTTVTIVNSGFTFSPASVTINTGDSIKFVLASAHDIVEVSQTTWNASGNTPLSGGFTTPFGGGLVLPAGLAAGTHYFVCSPHASMGMKGTIIVQNSTTGIAETQMKTAISVYPNPFSTQTFISFKEDQINTAVKIMDVLGKEIKTLNFSGRQMTIDRDEMQTGIYFVQITDCNKNIINKKIVVE